MAKWSLSEIPWDKFDPTKVNPDLVVLAKTASLVEYNSADYTDYLCNVFHDDAEFKTDALEWGVEERQHGLALAAWAKLADRNFDFKASLKKFTDAYRVPIATTESVRGSRARELLARCVIESGTTSYYSAIADATDEPALRDICLKIARDEVHHYNLFHGHLERYLRAEKISVAGRLKVVITRSSEVSDEELAFAYAAANERGPINPALVQEYSAAYLRRGFSLYRRKHFEKALPMVLRASGIKPKRWLTKLLSAAAHFLMQAQVRRAKRVARGLVTSTV